MFFIFEDVIGKKRKRTNTEEILSGFRYQIWKFQWPLYWFQKDIRNSRWHWGKKKKGINLWTNEKESATLQWSIYLHNYCVSCSQDYIHYTGRDLVCLTHRSIQPSNPVLICVWNNVQLITEECTGDEEQMETG